jgi:hypothetical protein
MFEISKTAQSRSENFFPSPGGNATETLNNYTNLCVVCMMSSFISFPTFMRALYIILNSSTLLLFSRREERDPRGVRSKKLLETSKVTYLLAEASANLKIGICLRRVTKT